MPSSSAAVSGIEDDRQLGRRHLACAQPPQRAGGGGAADLLGRLEVREPAAGRVPVVPLHLPVALRLRHDGERDGRGPVSPQEAHAVREHDAALARAPGGALRVHDPGRLERHGLGAARALDALRGRQRGRRGIEEAERHRLGRHHLVRQPRRFVLAGRPRHADRLLDQPLQRGPGEIGRVRGGRALAHEDADPERLAPGLGERLDDALAHRDRELRPLGDEDVGRVRPGHARPPDQLARDLVLLHGRPLRPAPRRGATKRS